MSGAVPLVQNIKPSNLFNLCSQEIYLMAPGEIAVDYFTHSHKNYLLIADTLSKYPFLYSVHSKTADNVIQHLQDLFPQIGTPT